MAEICRCIAADAERGRHHVVGRDSVRLSVVAFTVMLGALNLRAQQEPDLRAQRVSDCFPPFAAAKLPQACLKIVRSGVAADLGEITYSDGLALAVRAFPLPEQRVGISLEPITARGRSSHEAENGSRPALPEAEERPAA